MSQIIPSQNENQPFESDLSKIENKSSFSPLCMTYHTSIQAEKQIIMKQHSKNKSDFCVVKCIQAFFQENLNKHDVLNLKKAEEEKDINETNSKLRNCTWITKFSNDAEKMGVGGSDGILRVYKLDELENNCKYST